MARRDLLRNSPCRRVRAVVRNVTVSESFSRLSYEVGAEDGKGTLTPAWTMGGGGWTFEGTREMAEYHLERLEVFEGDMLDVDFLPTALRGVDCIVLCAATPVRQDHRPYSPTLSRLRGNGLKAALPKMGSSAWPSHYGQSLRGSPPPRAGRRLALRC